MRIVAQLTHSGEVLFRYRSWMPLLLLPLFVEPLARARYPFDSHGLDLAWEVACFLVTLGGLAIRIITTGAAPRGTSGRSTRTQKARVLNTTGAYSVVRHPLYLGNGLIALGVSSFPRAWYLPLIVSLAALLYYERIAMREEKYLRRSSATNSGVGPRGPRRSFPAFVTISRRRRRSTGGRRSAASTTARRRSRHRSSRSTSCRTWSSRGD